MATFLLVALGILLTMDALGVSIGPFLAGAGILGFAVTWSSQTLMKDVIMGMLILLEDQFAVGDVISLGDMGGFVENMNLRITQLRDANGQLITVSNSMITSVRNLSKDWARVDLSVPIPYDKDMPRAMHLIQQTAERMCADSEWKEVILDAPQLLGVDAFNDNGFVVRLWIQTQPLKQWDVERELRRRLKLAMDDQGIPIGVPQQEVWLRSADQNGERVHA
jgi:small conductance mechanosensitive channel